MSDVLAQRLLAEQLLQNARKPIEVLTLAASAITGSGAALSATVQANGHIVKRVIMALRLAADPDFTAGSMLSCTLTLGVYVAEAPPALLAGTDYVARAFALDSSGATTTGQEIAFSTLPPPAVTTSAVSSITATEASTGGEVVSSESTVTDRGIVYSVNPDPTLLTTLTSVIQSGIGLGVFTVGIAGLAASTTYYVRAYATSTEGTGYGPAVSFTTLPLPVVTTGVATGLASTSVDVAGSVSAGTGVVNYGILYSSTVMSPDISTPDAGGSSNSGTAPISFVDTMSGLVPFTTYYARAYAIDTAGTAYGEVVAFTTLPLAPSAVTATISNVSFTTADVTSSFTGDAVTSSGVVYSSVNTVPTLLDGSTDVANPGNSSTFTSSLTGLGSPTTYYVRTYVTNVSGTAFSAVATFATVALPVVTTAAVDSITDVSAFGGGTVVSASSTVLSRGIVYSVDQGPTLSSLNTTVTENGPGLGQFFSALSSLTALTTYYVRAYATSTEGTGYGAEVSFTTIALPEVTTGVAAASSTSDASVGGNVTTSGPVAYGIAYSSVNTSPTLADSFTTTSGSSPLSFTDSLFGLALYTTYYARAYASNPVGTAYGAVVTFTTWPSLPSAVAPGISNISTSSADAIASSFTGDGISASGVVYAYENNTPTLSDTVVVNTGNLTPFNSSLTGLLVHTNYFVRTYVTYAGGTVYSTVVSFQTQQVPATVATNSVIDITTTTATVTGTADAPYQITGVGVVYALSPAEPVYGTHSSVAGNHNAIPPVSVNLTVLSAGTQYNARVYAVSAFGTDYGNTLTFTTL